MDSVPLIPKAKVLPSLDVSPLLSELFQQEFQAVVPTKKLSQNIITSLQYERIKEEEKETFRSVDYLENLTNRRDSVIDFAENVLEAYENHERHLESIREAERNVFETHAEYLRREASLLEDDAARGVLRLRRQPLFKALDANHVKKYKLLEGDAGLPPRHEARSDFRVENFAKWRRMLEDGGGDLSLARKDSSGRTLPDCRRPRQKKDAAGGKRPKIPTLPPKKSEVEKTEEAVFRAEPQMVFFTDYEVGDVFVEEIEIKNVHTKGLRFQVKPTCPHGPFAVTLKEANASVVFPGLSFKLIVEFTPKSKDNAVEDVVVLIEDGSRLLILLVAYLEPPVLKTHADIFEFTKVTTERIAGSYIECGPCFTGDTKVTKLRFRCHRGSGEFFVMSFENWSRCHVDSVTSENILEVPPFRVYPVFFKMEKNQVIDLLVEFFPKYSGTHVENIVIACDNGEVRSLDLLADAVGWHSYFFSFQDSMLKNLPVDQEDDAKVQYYLDFKDVASTGKVEKVFCVSNNSNMPFEFQWKIREANVSGGSGKYLKLSNHQVRIDPESGTFEADSIWEFLVTVTFDEAPVGDYRMVLSLYVLNLPYQCIEEDHTIIQPTGFVRNLYSQSLYGEEEGTPLSPELLSLQGTYESLQESIRSYVECQSRVQAAPRQDFCRTTCLPNPGLCAKPLKKSKTFVNLGESSEDEFFTCACRLGPTEEESVWEKVSNDRATDAPKNEVIWDFVDVLVNEVELWAEVVRAKASLEPSVIRLCDPIDVGDTPAFTSVKIINHNRFPIVCSWIDSSDPPLGEASPCENSDKPQFSILFEGKSRCKGKSEENISEGEGNRIGWENERKTCRVFFEPQKNFTVRGGSELTCRLGVSARRSGRIKESLWLSVNDGDLRLQLLLLATAVEKPFKVSPGILDFGVLKQGTRCGKDFKIVNEDPNPLLWQIECFRYDFKKEKFSGDPEAADDGSAKREGVVKDDGVAVESFYMNARVPGIRLSLLEVRGQRHKGETWRKQYVLALSEVRSPVLSLSSPRFENAILAPPGTMYVGQKTSTRVLLKNQGGLETFYAWGHPFGCHGRKIRVEILPKRGRIENNKKLSIGIDLIPLEEGIISHCYIPCFFCRSAEPLILSIVGLAENLNVTFEVVDYPGQSHADASTFLRSPFYHTVLRMPWPVKKYDPNLSRRHVPEEEVLGMVCHCQEVEEEGNRAFGNAPRDSEPTASEQSLSSFEDGSEETGRKEDLQDFSLSDLSSVDKKPSEESSVQKYFSRDPSLETLCLKPQLEFLNVPFRTAVLRQFVIRNETPIATSFRINALTFGESKQPKSDRIRRIRDSVMGRSKDGFEEKLEKDRPLVIVVDPPQGELLGHDALCINVFAYGNTWGEYRDQLICQIKGIETASLKIFVQIVGHPIHFPNFDSRLKPTLRFEPASPTSDSLSKKVKVVNRSSIPLSIFWMSFLKHPRAEEEEEDHQCSDLNANLDSNHSGEESNNSTKVYLPKNASESLMTLRNVAEMKDFSLYSGESVGEENRRSRAGEKTSVHFSNGGKSEPEPLPFAGRLATQIFQVDPKEMSFDPLQEKTITVIFDPSLLKPYSLSKEFKGVLTGCVKLDPRDEECSGLFHRPCGANFASELMDLDALVETPLLSFEMSEGDLKFIVDSNAVLKSPHRRETISRRYSVKNNKEKSVSLKIEVVPGVIFRVKSVNTVDKLYRKYNPNSHTLNVESGQVLEMELQCSVTYRDVIYAYEQLKKNRTKGRQTLSMGEEKTSYPSETEEEKERRMRDPWRQFFDPRFNPQPNAIPNPGNCTLSHIDSLRINLNRRSSGSDNSVCRERRGDYWGEVEGEYLELPHPDEPPTPQLPHHVTVVKEEICFSQPELVTQSLFPELHLSFPLVKICPKFLDFGNVYLGIPAVRYFSIINLTGFPTEFRVKAKFNASDFVASPSRGSLPATNYNSDIGRTIAVEFKPSQPGHFKEVFQVFCNPDMEFDVQELFVAGLGTWNEKYKPIKFETSTRLEGIRPPRQK